MIEIRIHGRGGQGAVTSAEIVATAAIEEGKYAQGFPSFGPERRGAPVTAFVRVDDKPIRLREKVYHPDIVVVLDPTLLEVVDVAEGLKDNGMVVINSTQSEDEIKSQYKIRSRMALVDATKIALDNLGLPITNTTMLGALIKATSVVNIDSINRAIDRRFGPIAPKNKMALEQAYKETRVEQ
ncbi:MAG TPA: pyruvate ferredoxin oxidoreductase subunit gamma [Syntrophaceae bacterium]|nr:pyruvate ferredoxin oxidoreductase subunit gamma [Syntrophaceae bacterium]